MVPFSGEIRRTFINFFKNKNHVYVPQSSILQPNDPTIMFTNSGMVQFKEIFLGNKKINDKRLVNSQLCLRVSGKHNDLDEVGIDTYHHTLFEMLGNWSIGDFFKKEIIEWSYELLTEYYQIPKERIYVTVFAGDKGDDLKADDEAYNFWKRIVPEDHIVYGDKHDNFWEMGEIGPCGPCSEIHVDLREDTTTIPGRDLVNQGHPEVIEIWNLVFMQYERLQNRKLKFLNDHYVDTGMGFERLVRILQNKKSNYDTDIFIPFIVNLENLSNKKYGVDEKVDIAMRVISDHIRAVAVAICDGCIPSNVREGYVIRRILRRAIRYGYSFLNFQEPTLYELTRMVVSQYCFIKPEIEQKQFYIAEIIKNEEEDFLRTISRGIYKLDEIIKNSSKSIIDGRLVFELYDTFGFPADLTDIILKENNLTYDKESFEKALLEQKQRSRAASSTDCDVNWTMLRNDKQNFVGYEVLKIETTILGYREITDKKNKKLYHLILKENPFYGESGGQIGDTGTLMCNGEILQVLDSKKSFGIIYIITEKLPNDMNCNVLASVDENRRKNISVHHSATHLLQATLQQILGKETEQRGSFVGDKYLRFDFPCNDNMIGEKQKKIEQLLNEKIREGLELTEMRDVDFDEAKKMGAMCLFENKYGDKVRVIKFGDFSMELCGGTHVKNTKDIICCKITNIQAIARGIKRIEAVAGYAALNYFEETYQKLNDIGIMLYNRQDPVQATKNLIDDNIRKESLLGCYRQQIISDCVAELLKKVKNVNGRNFIFSKLDLFELDLAKIILRKVEKKIKAVIFLEMENVENNILINIGSVYDDVWANELVRKISDKFTDIKGGGNRCEAIIKTSSHIPNLEDFVMSIL